MLIQWVAFIVIAALSCACASPTAPSSTARGATVASQSAAQGAVSHALRRTKFMAFGDSFTLGEVTNPLAQPGGSFKMLVVPAASYPTRLLEMLRATYPAEASAFEVINAGRIGEWAQDGAIRFPQALKATPVEVVLLLQGTNDLAALEDRGVAPAAAAVSSMVKEAKLRGAEVILATVPPSLEGRVRSLPASLLTKYNQQLHQVALAENAMELDLYNGLLPDPDRYIGIDGLHPNEAGYTRIAELFLRAIQTKYETQ